MRMEGFFMPQESGTHTFALNSIGSARLFIDKKLVIDHTARSESGQQKFVDLELTANKGYSIRMEYVWQGHPRWRSVSLGHLPPHAPDLMAEAVDLAKRSDAVVLIAGLNGEWESEGFDRVDMKLPGAQNELIERVVAVNPNTVVVLNVGSAVEMPWIDKVPAVLQLWYDSQEQGNALADVLFGDVNPSGKLPTTFPVRLQDNPAYTNYPGENGKVRYGESIFVGYRYYDKKEIAPLFPFGHGLSYTTYAYSNLRLSAKSITPNELLEVQVDITNTGNVAGKEIVQVYVRDLKSTVARPEKELKAFSKVDLAPGQTRTLTFPLDREAFWYFDVVSNAWMTEPGDFEILVGSSSRDIHLRDVFTLAADPRAARLHAGLTIQKLLDDPDGRAILSKYIGGFLLMADMSMAKDMTLEQVARNHPTFVSAALLSQIGEELAKV
jgi:beta-glucosidase